MCTTGSLRCTMEIDRTLKIDYNGKNKNHKKRRVPCPLTASCSLSIHHVYWGLPNFQSETHSKEPISHHHPGHTYKRAERKTSFQRFLVFVFIKLAFPHFILFCLFVFSRATQVAYGGSQARGLTGAIATDLHHGHSNARSLTHRARPGVELATSWFVADSLTTEPQRELLQCFFILISASAEFQNAGCNLRN